MDGVLYQKPVSRPTVRWLGVATLAILLGIGLGALTILSPKLGLGISALILLFGWISPKPERGLYIIVALLPFEELTSVGSSVSGVKAVTAVVFIAWLWRLARTGHSRVDLSQRRHFFLIIFMAFVFLSLAQAYSLWAGITPLTSLISLVLFFFLVSDLVSNENILANVLRVLIFASVPAAILPIYQFARFGGRAGGASVNPNDSALTLVILVPLVLALLASQNKNKLWQRSVLWLVLALFVAGSLATLSRGGLIALGAILALTIAIGHIDARTKKIVAMGLGGLLVIGTYLALIDRRFSLHEIAASQAAGRFELWAAARWIFSDHWLTGVGLGNFREVMLGYLTRLPWVLPLHVKVMPTHNLFVQVAVETGVFGMLSFLAFIGSTFSHIRNIVQENLALEHYETAATYSMLIISLVGLLIGGLSKDMLLSKVFWLILALASTRVDIFNSRAADGQGPT